MPVPFHTMVSNVPGPQTSLLLGSAELVVPIGLGPVRDNMGLFHIVSSSATMMSLSFSACKKLLPDPGFYQQCLYDAYEALLERALEES
jgi:diacylglycerol O-acyltransferase